MQTYLIAMPQPKGPAPTVWTIPERVNVELLGPAIAQVNFYVKSIGQSWFFSYLSKKVENSI